MAVAGLLLANMVLAYRLLGEEGVAVDLVSGKPQQSEGGTAFGKLRETLDNLSSSEIGVPLLTVGNANQADPSGTVEASSATFTTESDTGSSSSSGSGSNGSNSSDEGSVNDSSDDSNQDSGEDQESDDSDEDSGGDPGGRIVQ